MASEGLSTDVLVAAAIEVSNPANTKQYEGLSKQDRTEQVSLDAVEEHAHATERAEHLESLVAKHAINSQIAQIPRK